MEIDYKRSFLRDIKKIKDQKIKKRIESVLLDLESATNFSKITGVKGISGTTDYFRIRIGDYRLGMRKVDEKIELIRFLSRGDIYRKFPLR